MRYYLDTNVLVAMLKKRLSDLNYDARALFEDYSNIFYTSSESVRELIHLLHIERVESPKNDRVTASDVLDWLDKNGIVTIYVNRTHMQAYSEMPVLGEHTDPIDRIIIAQAITDRIPLISSDLRFGQYAKIGLCHIQSK